jgi:GntR family transcriptional regulator/MocR family aminotransferase
MIEINLSGTSSKQYKYRQIYEGLKEKIISGTIPKHYKLPSKRALAKELKVSVNSVATAYEQLIAEGYIYTLEKKGYYVEEINAFNLKSPKEGLKDSLKETREKKYYRYSLSHMTTNSRLFPFKKWTAAENFIIKNYQHEISQLNHPQGPIEVREVIRDLVAVTRGIDCYAEQIVIGNGTQTLVSQLLNLIPKNVKIGVENPGYSRVRNMLEDNNLNVADIELDEQGIDINKIYNINPDLLFVTPSHQFPTGIIMPVSRRIDLLNWASELPERYIIEDDYDSEFKYGTDNIPSLHSLDKNQKVVYLGTFSKTLLPSFRISYMILPMTLLESYKSRHKYWLQGNNSIQLYTLKYFIESGEYSRHVKKMNHFYQNNRECLIAALRKQFGEDISIADIPAGLHFLVKIKTQKTYDEIAQSAEENSIELYDIRRFSADIVRADNLWKTFVIGFANINPEDMSEISRKLYNIVY